MFFKIYRTRTGRNPAIVAVTVICICLASNSAHADCLKLSFQITRPIVERFIFNQGTLLRDHPHGGEGLKNTVGILAMVSRATLPQIVAVSKAANTEQRQAIAAGLGIAAQRCKREHSDITRKIEAFMRDSRDSNMQKTFATNFKSDSSFQPQRNSGAGTLQHQFSNDPARNAEYRRTFDIRHTDSSVPIPNIGSVPPIQAIPSITPAK